ncbi:MAG TPA: hypothetical protein VFF00_09300 [Candidatus Elarobacter sp.]|nr:hypothetical protein [Dongiaceae bacterium]HZW54219.1 hypothetical protein [Candidatus Elarobacter sp.]
MIRKALIASLASAAALALLAPLAASAETVSAGVNNTYSNSYLCGHLSQVSNSIENYNGQTITAQISSKSGIENAADGRYKIFDQTQTLSVNNFSGRNTSATSFSGSQVQQSSSHTSSTFVSFGNGGQ